MIRTACLPGLLAAALFAGPIRAQDLPAEAPSRPADPRIGAATRQALDYLLANQKPDGAWEAQGFGKATSITSLAILAFLASGHLPDQPGPYRDAIHRGIEYVITSQKPNGLLVSNTSHGPLYCHGISTLMLAEVIGLSNDQALADRCRTALAKAVELILKAQAVAKEPDHAGGWRYQPTSHDSDLSVTGWQLIALRAARDAGSAVPASAIDDAVAYVKRCAAKPGGFAYQPGQGPNNPRTGTGILALEICGQHLAPESLAGAKYLAEHPPRWSSEYFFYEVYYVPQALFQLGDEYFRPYHEKLVDVLLQHQEKDGSWLSGDGNDRSAGRIYCTAMAALALAVESRYLPIYQR